MKLRFGGEMAAPVCPYCERQGVLTTGAAIYPHRRDLHSKVLWRCVHCPGVYVGCHDGTKTPLGNMCDQATRNARMRAHRAFDPLWKSRKHGSRAQAYGWLARELAMEPKYAHISMADVALCDRIVELSALAAATKNFNFRMELT